MNNENKNEVTVVDIKMPFMSMVTFMVKAALAAIPAIFILMVIFTFFTAFLGGIAGR